VDYDKPFGQAELKETAFIEHPNFFAPKSGKDLVLKILKSVYSLEQAPRTFF